jgi:hypothetical protein
VYGNVVRLETDESFNLAGFYHHSG